MAAACKILLFRFFLGIYDMIYLLNAIRLTPGGSNKVHIYTEQQNETEHTEQNIHNNKNT